LQSLSHTHTHTHTNTDTHADTDTDTDADADTNTHTKKTYNSVSLVIWHIENLSYPEDNCVFSWLDVLKM
jgi:hypothetical protein